MATRKSEVVPEYLPTDARFHAEVDIGKLLPVVLRAAGVCSSNSVHEGADLIQLEAKGLQDKQSAHIVIRASNGATFLDAIVPATRVDVSGDVRIPVDKLLSVLKQVTSGSMVTISCVGFEVQVSSENSLWRLKTPAKSLIPNRPAILGVNHRVAPERLLVGLRSVVKSAAVGMARASLTQVHVSGNYVIACDGARLHKQHVPDLGVKDAFEIPIHVAHLFISALKYDTDEVTLKVGEVTLSLITKFEVLTTLRSKLAYPDVEKLFISQSVLNDSAVQFARDDFLAAVKNVKNFADSLLSAVHIKSTDDNQILVQSEDEIGNAAQSRIPAASQGKSMVNLKLNYKHLIDALESTSSEMLEIRVGRNSKTTKSSAFIEDSGIGFQAVIGQVSTG